MVNKYLGYEQILAITKGLSEIDENRTISEENEEEAKELYRKVIGQYMFRPEHDKYTQLKVLSPIMIHLRLKRPRKTIPLTTLTKCYEWFNCVYGETLGDSSGSELPGGEWSEEGEKSSGEETSGSDLSVLKNVGKGTNTVDSLDTELYDQSVGGLGVESGGDGAQESKVSGPRTPRDPRTPKKAPPPEREEKEEASDWDTAAEEVPPRKKRDGKARSIPVAREKRRVEGREKKKKAPRKEADFAARVDNLEEVVTQIRDLMAAADIPAVTHRSKAKVPTRSKPTDRRSEQKNVREVYDSSSDSGSGVEEKLSYPRKKASAGGVDCGHPAILREFDQELSRRMKEERQVGGFGYGYANSDSDDDTPKRFRTPRLQEHQRSIARSWVVHDLGSNYRTAELFVDSKSMKGWKHERNKMEARFLSQVIDTLTREVGGGDYTYLLGTKTMELLVRRMLAVMTVDERGSSKKTWEVAQSLLAPVQRVPGIYMDPAAWQSAEKAASSFVIAEEKKDTGGSGGGASNGNGNGAGGRA